MLLRLFILELPREFKSTTFPRGTLHQYIIYTRYTIIKTKQSIPVRLVTISRLARRGRRDHSVNKPRVREKKHVFTHREPRAYTAVRCALCKVGEEGRFRKRTKSCPRGDNHSSKLLHSVEKNKKLLLILIGTWYQVPTSQ